MPKFNKSKKKAKRDNRKQYTTYEKEGFVFRFDDEQLQQRYINVWKHFNNIIGGNEGLPLPSPISYIHAVGMTRGKLYSELSYIQEVYENTRDHNYISGGKHKYGLFDEDRKKVKNAKTIEKFIEAMKELIDEVLRATQEVRTKGQTLRYNIVWYSRHPSS